MDQLFAFVIAEYLIPLLLLLFDKFLKNQGYFFILKEYLSTGGTTQDFLPRNYPTADTFGVWPYACDKLIPCLDVPHQTCGCKNRMDPEDFAIVYNMRAGKTF